MAILQDIIGLLTLKAAWPLFKSNTEAVNTQLVNHVAGTADKHAAGNVNNDSNAAGSSVKDALNDIDSRIDNLVVGASNTEIGVFSVIASGTNTYTGAFGGVVSYFVGMKLNLSVANKNTGASSFNLNSIGVKNIKTIDSSGVKQDVEVGELYGLCHIVYDGTDFILQTVQPRRLNTHMADYAKVIISVLAPPAPLAQATGNGVADDTAAIQACINHAAQSGGGKVVLPIPSSFYKFTTLNIPDSVEIEGVNRYKVILKTSAIGGTAIYFSGTAGIGTSKSRIKLSGFTLKSAGGTEAVDFGIKIDRFVAGGADVFPGQYDFDNIEITGLQKAGAIAFYADDVSHMSLSACLFTTEAGIAAKINGTAYNTGVMDFRSCVFGDKSKDTIGLWIDEGSAIDSISFTGCYYAGKTAAEKIGHGNNNVRSISHLGCHYENNTVAAGNAMVELAGGGGVGGIGLSWRNCSMVGFGNCELAFNFKDGYYYGISIEDCEFNNIKAAGNIVKLNSSIFKHCTFKMGQLVVTTPNVFSGASFRDDGGWFGGWTIIDTTTDFQKGLKISGKRIVSGSTEPLSGTYDVGDICINTAPTRTRNIAFWQCATAGTGAGATWRAHGTGWGTTAERPAVFANDAGYAYFDTTLAKMILWNGAAWQV